MTDPVSGEASQRALKVLADITERHAVFGKYVANDIRAGNLSPDNKRALAAMLAYHEAEQSRRDGEVERLREATEAADHAIDRWRRVAKGEVVRDVPEAMGAWESAKARILASSDPLNEPAIPEEGR